ncbi:Rrf2 family transcriptional regulator [Massilia sp. TS11]|uniref:RrF2 family transcriptional regulator n=1 Tax=Massilia sp. TS11 TaxID=2908003 RepID=UPI001EDC8528|nr:Rrf2 family transcriptional regulator [Massilia sp. TS11]MCG2586708.1 Rrf2 family transcriptional regulator [Massilia sp. TS11]
MRLTAYTDYALRTLMYVAQHRERLVTIQDIADAQGIAKNHLTKVVNHLAQLGYLETVRGRNGGLRLAREPEQINVGQVVRATETDFHMAACFQPSDKSCAFLPHCALKHTLTQAAQAFLAVLDAATLAQMLTRAPARTSAVRLKPRAKPEPA